MLAGAIQRVEQFQHAGHPVRRPISFRRERGTCIPTALATQRAELALDLFLQTRNKVVSAYQEIMRMQM